jgi:AcrR family transcriptional regulator
MPTRRKPLPAPRRKGTASETYHHGNLRAALILATLELLDEGGPDAVSVREVAKRVGVSAAAPFRHFPTRTALLTAVAEEASRRLTHEIATAVAAVSLSDPLERLRAFGIGYLRWVNRNQAMFLVVSTRSLVDYEGSPTLGPESDELRGQMEALLREAADKGLLRSGLRAATVTLAARAFVYGLARMLIDDHLRRWKKPAEKPQAALQNALDFFIDSLRAPA